MRKPFFRSQTQAWYFPVRLPDGRIKQVRLSRDRDEAFELFRTYYADSETLDDEKHERLGKSDVAKQKAETDKALPIDSIERKSPRLKPQNIRGRYESFERLILLASLLSPLRRGATADELHQDATDLLGRVYCLRTIKRDLSFFVQFGVVETDDGRRFRWLAGNRSNIIEGFADTLAS